MVGNSRTPAPLKEAGLESVAVGSGAEKKPSGLEYPPDLRQKAVRSVQVFNYMGRMDKMKLLIGILSLFQGPGKDIDIIVKVAEGSRLTAHLDPFGLPAPVVEVVPQTPCGAANIQKTLPVVLNAVPAEEPDIL